MRLNTIKSADGSRCSRKRVGRGIGSGNGKTAGRGHNGQKSRSGGTIQIGFEGGQMPLQRRLPKRGFRSRMASKIAEIRLHELNLIDAPEIDLSVLRTAGLVNASHLRAKVMLSGEITKAVVLKGIGATKGARAAIESAGGSVAD